MKLSSGLKYEATLVLLLLAMIFSACERKVAGGTDFPNEINGQVAKVDGTPVSAAKVRLYRKADANHRANVHATAQDFELTDSTETDAQGQFTLETDSGHFLVEALYDTNLVSVNDSIYFPGDTNQSISLDTLTLYFGGHLKGTIVSEDFTITKVDLAGTPYSTQVNADGSFYFKNLPPGVYGLISFYQGDQNITGSALNLSGRIEPDSTLDMGTIILNTDEVLFEDFEFNDERALTGYLYGAGWWFGVGSGEYIAQPENPGFPVSKSTTLEAGSQVFHAIWDFNSAADGAYYIFGFNIGHGADGYIEERAPEDVSFFDFSGVDKVAFRAKGTGTLRLQLGTRAVRMTPASEVAHYGIEFTLTDEFQDFAIDINDFVLGEVSDSDSKYLKDITWKSARRDVYAVSFIVTDNAEIWLDDIRLIDYNINFFK